MSNELTKEQLIELYKVIPEGYIIIPKNEYKRLINRQLKLEYLEQFGVDNWCGYDEAMKEYRNNRDNS